MCPFLKGPITLFQCLLSEKEKRYSSIIYFVDLPCPCPCPWTACANDHHSLY
uniref:Uncharacterized protein n=1 Tax=Anguilla anguilla TaxID=7936 RepID=A0A0E9R8D1_ANGAN